MLDTHFNFQEIPAASVFRQFYPSARKSDNVAVHWKTKGNRSQTKFCFKIIGATTRTRRNSPTQKGPLRFLRASPTCLEKSTRKCLTKIVVIYSFSRSLRTISWKCNFMEMFCLEQDAWYWWRLILNFKFKLARRLCTCKHTKVHNKDTYVLVNIPRCSLGQPRELSIVSISQRLLLTPTIPLYALKQQNNDEQAPISTNMSRKNCKLPGLQ